MIKNICIYLMKKVEKKVVIYTGCGKKKLE